MIRTGYSFNSAVGHLKDVMSRLVEIGWTVAPIADTNNTFAFVKWTKLAKKAGLRPVYGVELPISEHIGKKRQVLDWWTFLAKDSLRPLHDLIEEATDEMGLTYPSALAAKGVIKISGPAVRVDQLRPVDDFYMGLSPALPRALRKVSGFPKLAMNANRYPRETDLEFYRVLLGKFRSSSQTYPQHILSDQEWLAIMKDEEALSNRDRVLASCTAPLRKAKLIVPEKPLTLREMCEEGAKRLGVDLSNPVYAQRLDRELALIDEKQFEDYFYVIADLMDFARTRMIVGPARGSSCGSLVCYLLGITAIDPIPFNLLFERFIDTTRTDLPDIDLDFSDTNRHKIFEYIEQKYGYGRSARLGTVGRFLPRSVLSQAGVALRIPKWKIEKVLDNIIVRSSGDSRALQQLEDTLRERDAGQRLLKDHPEILIAAKMEGHPSVSSQHAAGIVLTQEPVREFVAVDAKTKCAMCDKKDAEELNLLKIDALGLTQLSIFERTLELIGRPPTSAARFLEQLPLDDVKAFNVLNAGHFAGIFQFMGSALKSLTRQVTITSISDIIAITALARPGPLASGGAQDWCNRKNGAEVTLPHPIFEPYLRDTLGVVMYQEQVMRIGREVGDLSWEDVTALRKAMSRSLGKEFFNQYGDRWKDAAEKKGVPRSVLDKVWDDLCAYGSWSFNASHAVAYGFVSYWCCWLKAHHPVEFAAATLDAESDPMRQIQLLRELKAEGIGYVAVDRERSETRWLPAGDTLIGPLTNIKGIGPRKVVEIMEHRRDGTELKPALKKLLDAAKTPIDSIYPVADRFAQLRHTLPFEITRDITPVIDIQPGFEGIVQTVAVAIRIVPRDENEEILIAKRGGRRAHGQTRYLNLFVQDDSDEIYCKISTRDFERLGLPVIEKGRKGKSLYILNGWVPRDFRMIQIRQITYVGDMDDDRRQSGSDLPEEAAAGSLAAN